MRGSGEQFAAGAAKVFDKEEKRKLLLSSKCSYSASLVVAKMRVSSLWFADGGVK